MTVSSNGMRVGRIAVRVYQLLAVVTAVWLVVIAVTSGTEYTTFVRSLLVGVAVLVLVSVVVFQIPARWIDERLGITEEE